MSVPSKRIAPEVGGSSRNSNRPMVVLPLPDSPTRPNTSPLRMEKSTPSTALSTLPRPSRKCLVQIGDLYEGLGSVMRCSKIGK